jgi:LacI family repressor for deo operon, udp, cdd, tsx, nupC, and nupG
LRAVDVAQATGVSTATVSRALRGLPGVSAAVREQVVRAAAELGYRISHSASSLASGRTMTIGIVTPYIDHWYFGQVIAAAEREFAAAHYDVLLHSLPDNDARIRFFQQLPPRDRVDALLVLIVPDDDELAGLASLGVPIVSVFGGPTPLPSVGIDEEGAVSTAMRHLIELGHRRIATIGRTGADPMRFSTPHLRRTAFRAELRSAGIEPDPTLEVDGDYTVPGGAAAMNALLALPERPTAVFAQSDEMAIGALGSLSRHGLSAPHDVSIVGIDGHDMAAAVGLSTVAQPVQELGALAARTLVQLLVDPSMAVPGRTELPTSLIVRDTTAPLSGTPRPGHRHADGVAGPLAVTAVGSRAE